MSVLLSWSVSAVSTWVRTSWSWLSFFSNTTLGLEMAPDRAGGRGQNELGLDGELGGHDTEELFR